MGITAKLKSVSKPTFKTLLENPKFVIDILMNTPFLDKHPQTRNIINKIYNKHKNYDWIKLENQLFEE